MIEAGEGVHITMTDTRVGPCPNCGGMGRVPDGPGASAGSTGDRKCADPDCDYDCGKLHLDTGRAFTRDEVRAVMEAARASKADIADLVAFLFGTGCRISEALHHVEWRDVDTDTCTVRIRGTKTGAADRTVTISKDLADVLAHRAESFGTTGLVFGITRYPSKMGRPRDKENVLKVLRGVLAKAGVPWAGSHTFRRTVATWLDDAGAGLGEIAGQLGHANTMTTMQYVKRKTAPSRAASVMTLLPLDAPNLSLVAG